MIRHFGFIEGIPTVVPSAQSILIVESTAHGIEANGTERVSHSACYLDNPRLSYEFASTAQFRHWLDQQGRMHSHPSGDDLVTKSRLSAE